MALYMDHLGISVKDLRVALKWWMDALGGEVTLSWTEQPTNIPKPYWIGLPDDKDVRLQGAMLDLHGTTLEFHQYFNPPARVMPRKPSDSGLSHFAFRADDVDDLRAEYERLKEHDMEWWGEPREITQGNLAGHWWVYGLTPPQSTGGTEREDGLILQLALAPPAPRRGIPVPEFLRVGA